MAKIVGNVVGIPNPQSDWEQNDETKADYIKNKPDTSNFAGGLKTTISGVGNADLYIRDIDHTEHYIEFETDPSNEIFLLVYDVAQIEQGVFEPVMYNVVDGKARFKAIYPAIRINVNATNNEAEWSLAYNKSITSFVEEVEDTMYDRTTCKTTKSGRGSVTVEDADDTDHDILIKAVPISEEYSEEQGLFAITISVPTTGEEYQIGSPTLGEVITNPRSPFTAEIRGPQQAYFSVEVTYNTSVSKGFEDFKAETDKAIGNIDTALDAIITQQESIIAQQESILAIQNSLIGGEIV